MLASPIDASESETKVHNQNRNFSSLSSGRLPACFVDGRSRLGMALGHRRFAVPRLAETMAPVQSDRLSLPAKLGRSRYPPLRVQRTSYSEVDKVSHQVGESSR
jgi:hypothetical protein